jgi:hypothetical protein
VPPPPAPPAPGQPATAVRTTEAEAVEPTVGTTAVAKPEKQKPTPLASAETAKVPVALEGM